MKTIDLILGILVAVALINWGTLAWFNFNLVEWIFRIGCFAEERVFGDVAVDAFLISNTPCPVAAGIAIDIATGKRSYAIISTADCFSRIENNNSIQ